MLHCSNGSPDVPEARPTMRTTDKLQCTFDLFPVLKVFQAVVSQQLHLLFCQVVFDLRKGIQCSTVQFSAVQYII